MGTGVAEMIFKEPPENWNLEQFDNYIQRLIALYRPVAFFMKMQDEGKFNMAEALFEKIWLFRDARHAKFPNARDQWMLVEEF